MIDFEYSKEWYGSRITDDWLLQGGNRLTGEGLKQWYDGKNNDRYRQRFAEWFKGIEIEGRGLELGFQCGKTAHWIKSKYPDLVLDILDWNEELKKIVEPIREISAVNEIFFQDCQDIQKDDGFYDNVFSLDFYEHLTEDIYFNSIKEVHRLLPDGGKFFVFLGHTKHPAHINVRPVPTIVRDIASRGFKHVGQRISFGDVMNIFEK
jgi:hypothetical protein